MTPLNHPYFLVATPNPCQERPFTLTIRGITQLGHFIQAHLQALRTGIWAF